jgi:hypothetical protein
LGSRNIREGIQSDPFMATMSHITAANRRARRAREKRPRGGLMPASVIAPLPQQTSIAPDPVRIAVLAMENLGRASLRASCTGTEVRVAAPDEVVAAIFRAALAETGRTRMTDRLIRVVID